MGGRTEKNARRRRARRAETHNPDALPPQPAARSTPAPSPAPARARRGRERGAGRAHRAVRGFHDDAAGRVAPPPSAPLTSHRHDGRQGRHCGQEEGACHVGPGWAGAGGARAVGGWVDVRALRKRKRSVERKRGAFSFMRPSSFPRSTTSTKLGPLPDRPGPRERAGHEQRSSPHPPPPSRGPRAAGAEGEEGGVERQRR